MKAIGYIRVSTEEQSADDKYGIEVQKQAISDYANRNDFEIVCWLTDTISGAKDNRNWTRFSTMQTSSRHMKL